MLDFFRREPLFHYPMDRFGVKSPILYRPGLKIVHVGGGPTRNHPWEWNLNLFRMPNIDVVGSAERLPFQDASVDVLISNAVLEHVRDLPAVLGELRRVLKPGGFVYVEIPFVQHYHTHDPHGVQFEDYRRLTKVGLAEALNFCTPLDIGVCVGPMSTVVQMLRGFAEGCWASAGYQRWIERLYHWAGNCLVWVDGVLPDQVIERSTIPSGIYFFGRKPDLLTPQLAALPAPNSIFPRDVVADIALVEQSPSELRVNITNTSRTVWLTASPLEWGVVNVGLQSASGGRLDRDFARVPLPRDIRPGESFPVTIDAAMLVGINQLTIDLVVEGLCWFADHGSKPLSIPCTAAVG